jgi:Domain of unknown function (DUF4371)/hAT family C-terminal dimerisation region
VLCYCFLKFFSIMKRRIDQFFFPKDRVTRDSYEQERDVEIESSEVAGPSENPSSEVTARPSVSENEDRSGQSKSGGGRKFQEHWKSKYSWITYDAERDCVYCGTCKNAVEMKMPLPTQSREKDSFAAFVEKGFSNWKKALDRFFSHERSEFHKAAISTIASSSGPVSVASKLSAQQLKEMTDSRHALSMIFTSLRFLAAQGLAIRGKTDETSNFRQLLELRSTDSVTLRNWLQRDKYKWLSPEITNEILEMFSLAALRELIKSIKAAKYYSVMLDETADISAKEQISFCIRVVDSDFCIHEYFFGFYQTDDTRSATLFKCFKDVLTRFDLSFNDCRGQCYDGAANMSGSISGLQTLIRGLEVRALYVHCRAHTLNLVAQDCVENVTEIRNAMNLVQKFVAFARGSPKRLACFNRFQSDEGTSLRPFCPTRWLLRKQSICSITSNYAAILQWLTDFTNHKENARIEAEASGLLESFTKFDTFIKLELLRILFTIVEDSNTALQGAQLNFREAESIINSLKSVIQMARTDERFETFWKSAITGSEGLQLDEPILPRRRRVPTKFDGSGQHHFPSTPEEHYRRLYFETIDSLVIGLQTRFEPTETSEHLVKVEDFVIGKGNISYIEEFYKDDFEDYRRLQLHRDIFVDHAKSSNIELKDFQSALRLLQGQDNNKVSLIPLIPEFVKLVKLVLCIPVSTCTAERSFSGLRRLKTYLRSTMSQERLNHLAVMSCHSNVVHSLNCDALIDEFVRKAPVRMNTFAVSR